MILETQKEIDDLKLKIEKADKSQREKLKARQKELQQELNTQKQKLNQQYIKFDERAQQVEDSVTTKVESFKKEFKQDLERLREAIKGFGESNEK